MCLYCSYHSENCSEIRVVLCNSTQIKISKSKYSNQNIPQDSLSLLTRFRPHPAVLSIPGFILRDDPWVLRAEGLGRCFLSSCRSLKRGWRVPTLIRILLCFPQKSANATIVLSQGQSGFKKVSDNPSIFCCCFWAILGLWLCALWLCVQKLLMAGRMDHIGCWTIKAGSTCARQMFSQLCYYQSGPCSSFLTRPLWCRLCSLNILCICLCYG